MSAPKKIRDLDWFELCQKGDRFLVFSPTALAGDFNTYRRALEFVAGQPGRPSRGDRGPIRHARHIAKCLLAELDQ